MQDLEIIQRKNKEAVEAAAAKAARDGKFVVIKFNGLNFIDYEAYDDEASRNQAAIDWANAGPGHRAELIHPTH